ncbi:hypothetical protein SUNI508_12865 [Seiridium unicorne]|uniref:MARVEL domain-containing protein n=1 Tax=Seiridium unicorne TaxID=138068 RepID=A0ABR2VHB0_9PEZI
MANDGKTVIPTPTWVLVARIFQFILSLIVVGASGWFIHGLYLSSLGFAIVCSLFTWIIFVYAILSERVSSCHGAYNTWAILSLDGLMIIFWLSAMAAVAATRGEFNTDVIASCTSDGSAVDSGSCNISKRVVYVASYGALGVMSGVAGVSAIIMLLFVATFAYVCHQFRMSWVSSPSDAEKQTGNAPGAANAATHYQQPGVEMHSNMPAQQQAQPLLHQQQGGYPAQQQEQPQWAEAQVYPQHTGYSQQGAAPPQYNQGQPYDPYVQQNTGYAGATGPYSPNQVGHPNQVPYSPQGTPAPVQAHGQPVYQLPTNQQ